MNEHTITTVEESKEWAIAKLMEKKQSLQNELTLVILAIERISALPEGFKLEVRVGA